VTHAASDAHKASGTTNFVIFCMVLSPEIKR